MIHRMMIRLPGQSPSAETMHRDEAKGVKESDRTFGGWLNLDDTPQFLNCVVRTHLLRREQGGFAKIKEDEQKKYYEERRRTVEIPPGAIIVFYEDVVHEIRASKAKTLMVRLFLGWRLTKEDNKSD